MDASGRRLARARLPEGMAGMARLHAMIGQALGDDIDVEDIDGRVKIGIESDRGPWVQALVAARVHGVFGVLELSLAPDKLRSPVGHSQELA